MSGTADDVDAGPDRPPPERDPYGVTVVGRLWTSIGYRPYFRTAADMAITLASLR
jgi:hypothetical protein